ncbi:unnamed protein product, partial [Ectocarpus fasciculatus]
RLVPVQQQRQRLPAREVGATGAEGEESYPPRRRRGVPRGEIQEGTHAAPPREVPAEGPAVADQISQGPRGVRPSLLLRVVEGGDQRRHRRGEAGVEGIAVEGRVPDGEARELPRGRVPVGAEAHQVVYDTQPSVQPELFFRLLLLPLLPPPPRLLLLLLALPKLPVSFSMQW